MAAGTTFIADLKGDKGDKGDEGPQGDKGDIGDGYDGYFDDVLWALTFLNGGRTWLEVDEAGGPTQYAVGKLQQAIGSPGGRFIAPTGSNDHTSINAALIAFPVVVLSGTYVLGDAVKMPSNRTLILQNATLRLAGGVNSNVIRNLDQDEGGNSNIRVIGIGGAVLDGNGSNQTRQTTAGWKNVGVNFVNAHNYVVRGVTIKDTNCFGALQVGSTEGVWSDITFSQDRSVTNQDGIDIGPGCSNIFINNVRGVIEDDMFSIFAKYTTSARTIHPLYVPGGAMYSAAGNDTHHIYINDVHIDTTKSLFRMQAAEGSKLHHVYASNVNHTGVERCHAFVNLGELVSRYIEGTFPAQDGSDFHDIHIDGLSGAVGRMVYVSTNARDVHLSDLTSDDWGGVIGTMSADEGTVTNLSIDGVTTTSTESGKFGSVVAIAGASVGTRRINGLTITGLNLAAVASISNSSATVTDANISGQVGAVYGTMFAGSRPIVGRVSVAVIDNRTLNVGDLPSRTSTYSSITN